MCERGGKMRVSLERRGGRRRGKKGEERGREIKKVEARTPRRAGAEGERQSGDRAKAVKERGMDGGGQ